MLLQVLSFTENIDTLNEADDRTIGFNGLVMDILQNKSYISAL